MFTAIHCCAELFKVLLLLMTGWARGVVTSGWVNSCEKNEESEGGRERGRPWERLALKNVAVASAVRKGSRSKVPGETVMLSLKS